MSPVPLFILALAAQDVQAGARAMGMGGGTAAFSRDPVMIWLNPGAMVGERGRLQVDVRTTTQYELEPGAVPSGDPELGLPDPAYVPSFLGFTAPVAETEDARFALGAALVRPMHTRLTYANGPSQLEVEQGFFRLRGATAGAWSSSRPGFLHSIGVGLAVDLGVGRYEQEDEVGGLDERETDIGFGYGAGVLVGVYTDGESLAVDVGLSFQSEINSDFGLDPQAFPAWDDPAVLNAGVAVRLLEGMALRLTAGVQFVFWDDATGNDLTGVGEDLEDSVNGCFGAEIELPVGGGVSVLPRAGIRIVDAPWDDEDTLPAIGNNILVVDTDDDAFVLFTFGASVAWRSGERLRAIDVGVETGGDTTNVAAGYRHDF